MEIDNFRSEQIMSEMRFPNRDDLNYWDGSATEEKIEHRQGQLKRMTKPKLIEQIHHRDRRISELKAKLYRATQVPLSPQELAAKQKRELRATMHKPVRV